MEVVIQHNNNALGLEFEETNDGLLIVTGITSNSPASSVSIQVGDSYRKLDLMETTNQKSVTLVVSIPIGSTVETRDRSSSSWKLGIVSKYNEHTRKYRVDRYNTSHTGRVSISWITLENRIDWRYSRLCSAASCTVCVCDNGFMYACDLLALISYKQAASSSSSSSSSSSTTTLQGISVVFPTEHAGAESIRSNSSKPVYWIPENNFIVFQSTLGIETAAIFSSVFECQKFVDQLPNNLIVKVQSRQEIAKLSSARF